MWNDPILAKDEYNRKLSSLLNEYIECVPLKDILDALEHKVSQLKEIIDRGII